MRRWLAGFDRAIARVDLPLVGACLVAAVLLNVALVAGRVLFSYSANATEELSVYAIIWMVFLGAVLSDRLGHHIEVDILYHFVAPRRRRTLRRVADALQGLTCLVLTFLTLKTVLFTYRIGEVSLSTLQAPVWVLMAVMPPCFLILALRGLVRAIDPSVREVPAADPVP
jgi:C4-dicarboxylate transporter DctQ subunit